MYMPNNKSITYGIATYTTQKYICCHVYMCIYYQIHFVILVNHFSLLADEDTATQEYQEQLEELEAEEFPEEEEEEPEETEEEAEERMRTHLTEKFEEQNDALSNLKVIHMHLHNYTYTDIIICIHVHI